MTKILLSVSKHSELLKFKNGNITVSSRTNDITFSRF